MEDENEEELVKDSSSSSSTNGMMGQQRLGLVHNNYVNEESLLLAAAAAATTTTSNDPQLLHLPLPPFSHLRPLPPSPPPSTSPSLPSQLDWSIASLNPLGRSVVSPPINQGHCGGCWSIVSASVVESAVAIATHGPLTPLSAQELLDCDVSWNAGCLGGNPIQSFGWVKKHGLAPAASYPYKGQQQQCLQQQIDSVSSIEGYKILRANDEGGMEEVVARQPVAVGVAGQKRSFLFYSGGVYDDTVEEGGREGGKEGVVLNHALVVVGYGVDKKTGLPFWRCKNSWGKEWGEEGYVRIRRREGGREGGGEGGPGVCGVAVAPSVPVGAYGGNVTAWLQARRKEEGEGGREEVVKKKEDDDDDSAGGGGGGGTGGGRVDPLEPFVSLLPEWTQRVLVGVGGTMLLLLCAVYFYGRPVVGSTPPTTAAAAAGAGTAPGGGYQPVWNGRGEGGREGEGEGAALRGGGDEESKYGSV